MTQVRAIPSGIDDWRALPTDPEGIPLPGYTVVAYGPDGCAWTDEAVRRFWRRTARTTLRAAFMRRGYDLEVFDEVVLAMERALCGYHGEGEPRSAPVPFFSLAWAGVTEGFKQAWDEPRELLNLAEDEAPTLAYQEAAADLAEHTRGLFTNSLTRPKGAA